MVQLSIDKKNFNKLVAAMLKAGKVRGPLADSPDAVLGDFSANTKPDFDYTNFKLPPKRELFPQCEVISRYDTQGTSEVLPGTHKTMLFGVRPCDAQSIAHLDRVFNDGKFVDPYYQARRDNTLIVSLACEKPADTCFCSSTNGGPAGTAGADIVAFNLGESLLFETVTDKGKAFLDKNDKLFRKPAAAELQKRAKQEANALKHLPKINATDAPKALAKNDEPSLWDSVAETCLSCGACTYLCPTCHCFDLFDDTQADGGRKLRVHDACMFTAFTREASGHNPRSKPGERMRQRVMHKFSYAPENFNELFCVGCGRCIANCPSNIDIRETVSRVTL